MEQLNKKCTKCLTPQPLSNFAKSQYWCRNCCRVYRKLNKDRAVEAQKRWRAANPDKKRASTRRTYERYKDKQLASSKKWREANARRFKNSYYLRRFGITIEKYEELLQIQKGKCALCERTHGGLTAKKDKNRQLAVDHSHLSGNVRGLLCGKHNKGLGLFDGKIEELQKAIYYLKSKGEG